jgi:hypothetical protein
VGRARGFDRYLTTTAEGTQEVLVTPETALPVEINVQTQSGANARSTMAYEPFGVRGQLRKLTRTDQGLGAAGRAVTEVELSNAVVSDGAQP